MKARINRSTTDYGCSHGALDGEIDENSLVEPPRGGRQQEVRRGPRGLFPGSLSPPTTQLSGCITQCIMRLVGLNLFSILFNFLGCGGFGRTGACADLEPQPHPNRLGRCVTHEAVLYEPRQAQGQLGAVSICHWWRLLSHSAVFCFFVSGSVPIADAHWDCLVYTACPCLHCTRVGLVSRCSLTANLCSFKLSGPG
jgi:hypothetical protein